MSNKGLFCLARKFDTPVLTYSFLCEKQIKPLQEILENSGQTKQAAWLSSL